MNTKQKLINELSSILNGRIEEAKQAIASLKEASENETKSSAGDKYETAREMMQAEKRNNELQLSKALLFHP